MVTDTPQYITSASDLERAAGILEKSPAVAVDLEADSMYHFEEKVCLVQMATDDACFIIDPLAVSDLSALRPMFADPAIVKIFHGADYDVRSLFRDFRIAVINLFDTELASRFLGYTQTSLEAVLKRHFDIQLDKKFQKKDWSKRPLPEDMIAYAAADVCYLVDLYHRLKTELAEKHRLGWALESCAEISRVRADGENGGPLFLRVKGAGRLDPRGLAILESLLRLRLEIARKKDRPPFKILGNQSLLDIARMRPANAAKLLGTGVVSEKQYHMYGSEIARVIAEALELPNDALPRYPRIIQPHQPMVVTRRIQALKEWRDRKAARLEMDPSMLLTKAAMKKISETAPRSVGDLKETGELREWQIAAFGEEWLRILRETE